MDGLKTCAGCQRRSDRVTCQLVAFFTYADPVRVEFAFEHDGRPQAYALPRQIQGQGWAKHLDTRPDDAEFQQYQLDLARAAHAHLTAPETDCAAYIAHDVRVDLPEVDVAGLADAIWGGVTRPEVTK